MLPTVAFDPTKTIIPRKSLAVFYPRDGTRQVETATVVGTITTAGNATVTVTAVGVTGSPVAVSVAVLLNDTALQVATKIRTALAANSPISSIFYIGGSGPDIVLTKILAGANDATVNIAIANGTCAGLTAAPTSVDTIAGLAAGVAVNLIGKALDYGNKFTTVMRKVPGAIDGLLRADRIVAIEQEQDFSFEIEDLKAIFLGIFGGLDGGFVQGAVQLFVVDPDDATGVVAVKSNYFNCTAELDGGIKFKAGEVCTGKVKFTALEKATLTPNAVA